jgi:hypothetical protein
MGSSEQPEQTTAIIVQPVLPPEQPKGIDTLGWTMAFVAIGSFVLAALGLYFKVKRTKKE